MSAGRVVIPCDRHDGRPRHRWAWVTGTMATREHHYVERRCTQCGRYESEVR